MDQRQADEAHPASAMRGSIEQRVDVARSPLVQDPRSVLPSVIDRAGPNACAHMPREGSAELARASYAHVRSERI